MLIAYGENENNQKDNNWSLDIILTAIILVLWVFTLLFIFCDFGQKLINQFESFEYKIYRCKWYLFPMKMQQSFVFGMMNVQQLAVVEGFGNIELSRETSKKVIKRLNIWK